MLFILFLIFCLANNCKSNDINEIEAFAYGEGLEPDQRNLHVHYFYLQFIKHGKNISVDENLLDVKIHGNPESNQRSHCRIAKDVFRIDDGLFLIRYLVYETCVNFQIELLFSNLHIAESPYTYESPIYPEKCFCPDSLASALEKLQCPSEYKQINEDLKHFEEIDYKVIFPQIMKHFNHPNSMSIVHYVIKGNKIHRKSYGKYTGFKTFLDAILMSVLRKVQLPDIEFFANLGDWPLVTRNLKTILPMFSWCKSNETYDIVMPTYEITESTLNAITRVSLDLHSVQKVRWDWNAKVEKAFFRGRDSRQERLDLIRLARKFPDLINASLTNFFFHRSEEAELGPKVPHMSFFDFFEFKYQLNIDGTVSAYRLPYLLAGNSLVFKQESTFYEHFYRDLVPFVHYVPIKHDLSDLIEKIEWARKNDDLAFKIMQNARDFTRNNLMPTNIYCYFIVLMNEYSKKITSKIEVLKDMEKVEDNSIECSCRKSTAKDEL